ncbi:hypothetical protein [Desulfogranum mediterraneum]|uniref:hypothetical protein n=1 Tax=Desulfogranum mediterraneum TaxID=160661 RepID=UPI00040821C2|nr:hypothetical protein [Desulfogranum mediterraneum]
MNPRPLLEAGCGRSLAEEELAGLLEEYPTASSWLASLNEEALLRLTAWLEQRHGCYARFGRAQPPTG